MFNIHFGQNWDIYWHNQPNKVPTVSQYFQMVENKTSVLPRICTRFIAEQTGQDEETKKKLVKIINQLGSAFQI